MHSVHKFINPFPDKKTYLIVYQDNNTILKKALNLIPVSVSYNNIIRYRYKIGKNYVISNKKPAYFDQTLNALCNYTLSVPTYNEQVLHLNDPDAFYAEITKLSYLNTINSPYYDKLIEFNPYINIYKYNIVIHKALLSTNNNDSIKYFNMAINLNIEKAHIYFAKYYKRVGNLNEMEKQYLIAINKGEINAMVSLGDYYSTTKMQKHKMAHCYKLAVENGDTSVINKLQLYYLTIQDFNEYENITKLFLKIHNNKQLDIVRDTAFDFGLYYLDEKKDCYEALDFLIVAYDLGLTSFQYKNIIRKCIKKCINQLKHKIIDLNKLNYYEELLKRFV